VTVREDPGCSKQASYNYAASNRAFGARIFENIIKMKKGAKFDANAVFNATLAPGVSNHGR
jgi:hypothetical protein